MLLISLQRRSVERMNAVNLMQSHVHTGYIMVLVTGPAQTILEVLYSMKLGTASKTGDRTYMNLSVLDVLSGC